MSGFKFIYFIGAMLSFSLSAEITNTSDKTPELQKQVFEIETAFAKTMADRDFDAFRSFLSDEAVFLSGKTPRRGIKQISKQWKKYFTDPAAPFSWKPEIVQVLESGKLAISTGPVFNSKGKLFSYYTSTWRLDDDGRWRIIFDKGNKACKAE